MKKSTKYVREETISHFFPEKKFPLAHILFHE